MGVSRNFKMKSRNSRRFVTRAAHLKTGNACIGAYLGKEVIWLSLRSEISELKTITPTEFWGPKHNFFSLTVCTLDQYFINGIFPIFSWETIHFPMIFASRFL